MKTRRIVKTITSCLFITSLIILNGCQTNNKVLQTIKKPWQEVFHSDQKKNKEQFPINNQIDYSDHDKKFEYEVVGTRAYLDEDPPIAPVQIQGVTLEPNIQTVIDLPANEEISIPEIGTKGFKDGQGNIIIIYPARNPAPDLKILLEKFLTDIEVSEFPNQNKLLIKFPESKLNNPEFKKQLGVTLDHLDQPAIMVRVKFRAFYLWLDNTYNREMIIDVLKDGIRTFHFNLPSSYDPDQRLTTGINMDNFYGIKKWKDFTLEGSVGFLDSVGNIDNLISVDALVANTKTFTYIDQLKVPYPTYTPVGTSLIETIKFEDVGLDLKIAPFANENGFITIKIEQAKSGELAALLAKTQRPTFKAGDFSSEFTVRNGVPYVAVVAMSNRFHSINRGIPGINKIPILKSLTSSEVIEKNQSELIILIEARIVPRDSLLGTITTKTPIKQY